MPPEPRFPSTHTPAGVAERNIDDIGPVVKRYLSKLEDGQRALEISAGKGVHLRHYAQCFPALRFTGSECDDYGLAHLRDDALPNIDPPVMLDLLSERDWTAIAAAPWDLALGTNFMHMVPFPEGAVMLFRHLRGLVHPGSLFLLYGPFKNDTGFFSESDAKFDASIKSRPRGDDFGLRSIDEVKRIAEQEGWGVTEQHNMPKGNLLVVFQRLQ